MTKEKLTAIVTVFYKKISSLPMMEALKKLVTFAAAVAVLLLLLYIAFYLFLVGLLVIAGIVIYVKLKGIGADNTKEAAHHYWWQHQEKHNRSDSEEGQRVKTVILETTEYKEVTIEDEGGKRP